METSIIKQHNMYYQLSTDGKTTSETALTSLTGVPAFLQFASQLQEKLHQIFIGARLTDHLIAEINRLLAVEFNVLNFSGVVYIPFEGMRVIGAKATLANNKSRVWVEFLTDFFPDSLHPNKANAIALGTYQGCDLYIGLQGSLPPTLLVQYGDEGDQYRTLNPHLTSAEIFSAIIAKDDHFREAFARASWLEMNQIGLAYNPSTIGEQDD